MDGLDIKILREMQNPKNGAPLTSEVRVPLRSIAKAVGADKETVRTRIANISRSHFMRGWLLFVNPGLLGFKVRCLWLEGIPIDSKPQALRRLTGMPGVLLVQNFFGDSIYAITWYNGEEALADVLGGAMKVSSAQRLTHAALPFPRCRVPMLPTDWRIVGEALRSPQDPPSSISIALGVSTRMVKRRLDRMMNGSAVFLLPAVDPSGIRGTLADFTIFYTDTGRKSDVDRAAMAYVERWMLRAELGDREHATFNLIISNVVQAAKILEWARTQAGIRDPRVNLVQERIRTDLYVRTVGEKLAGMGLSTR